MPLATRRNYRVAIRNRRRRPYLGWTEAIKAVDRTVASLKRDGRLPNIRTRLERKAMPGRAPPSTPRYPEGRGVAAALKDIAQGSQGGYAQWEQEGKRTGKKQTRSSIADVLVKRNIDTAVTCFKNLNQFNGTTGAVPCGHYVDTSLAKRYLPVYLFDLMAMPAPAPTGIGYGFRQFMYTGAPNDGVIGWEPILGKDAAALDSAYPYYHYASTNFPQSAWNNDIHFGKTSIKLNLWGHKTRPVKWEIKLVKFTSDEYTPVSDDGLSLNQVTSTMGNAFWQAGVKRLVGNPIADQPSIKRGCMKVIAKKSVEIGPITNIESDTRNHVHTLYWTHYINKVVGMRKAQVVEGDDANVVNVNQDQPDTPADHSGAADYTPLAKDRLYLMVACQTFTEVISPTAVDSTNTPYFDYNLKTTVRCIQ